MTGLETIVILNSIVVVANTVVVYVSGKVIQKGIDHAEND